MDKIGIIAGKGALPMEFLDEARQDGRKITVFALQGITDKTITEHAEKVYWLKVGEFKKFAFLLIRDRIKQLALLGKVDKSILYREHGQDDEYRKSYARIGDTKDYSILQEVTRRLGFIGVSVMDSTVYLKHLLPEKGFLGSVRPDDTTEKDISFGYDIAKKISGMDIGQTVVVKGGTIVAVEAIEGTDETIKRAGALAGSGCVMVKVSRPHQDMRWDVPTIGADTIRTLVENKFKALAIESGRMFVMDRQQVADMSGQADITIKVI
ncbi:MAG: UDP-2,3-diacylglucosamine diphosphatase LpxI [Candidatus Omnitrophica bacterium]|nr:UDP-2,3-diacylglucosamine diphosphatase LpxI [Candidatus Omnitrophota bacterium]MDD5488208.1 UDP-2,3-diacylglucosamine diphosphatase LpxI [Candidatus Omnitrophota bacterium]